MTYIIGAQCNDGVVLVGDTKITIGSGTEFSFAKKIINPSHGVVVGSSGSTGLYRIFQSRLILGVQDIIKKGDENINWNEELILLAERSIHEIAATHGTELTARNLDALVVIRSGLEPELIHLSGRGVPDPITDYAAVGHGEPYGSIILKTIWNQKRPMRMLEFAKLGCLAIKYVQDLELDYSVGFEPKGTPQVWIIPKIPLAQIDSIETDDDADRIFGMYKIKELSENEVKFLMKNVNKNINEVKTLLNNLRL